MNFHFIFSVMSKRRRRKQQMVAPNQTVPTAPQKNRLTVPRATSLEATLTIRLMEAPQPKPRLLLLSRLSPKILSPTITLRRAPMTPPTLIGRRRHPTWTRSWNRRQKPNQRRSQNRRLRPKIRTSSKSPTTWWVWWWTRGAGNPSIFATCATWIANRPTLTRNIWPGPSIRRKRPLNRNFSPVTKIQRRRWRWTCRFSANQPLAWNACR